MLSAVDHHGLLFVNGANVAEHVANFLATLHILLFSDPIGEATGGEAARRRGCVQMIWPQRSDVRLSAWIISS